MGLDQILFGEYAEEPVMWSRSQEMVGSLGGLRDVQGTRQVSGDWQHFT